MEKTELIRHDRGWTLCRYRPGTEPALILLHGAGGDSGLFRRQLDGIPGPAMVAIDMPGHGGSVFNGEPSLSDYVDAAEAAADHFGFKKFVPAGHSMGSGIVFELWKRRPDRMAGLVVIAAGAALPVNPALFDLIRDDYKGFCGMAGSLCFAPGVPPELAAAVCECMMKAGPGAAARDFRFCSEYSYNEVAASIDAPLLIIAHEKDRMVSRKVIAALHETVKGSRLALLPGEGHMPHLDDAERVNREIGEFMNSL